MQNSGTMPLKPGELDLLCQAAERAGMTRESLLSRLSSYDAEALDEMNERIGLMMDNGVPEAEAAVKAWCSELGLNPDAAAAATQTVTPTSSRTYLQRFLEVVRG